MGKQRTTIICLFISLLGLIPVGTPLAAPNAVNYQGILGDSGGSPVPDQAYSMVFRIYDAATTGALLYEESQTVSTVNGIYNVLLGAGTVTVGTFDPALFSTDNRWLEVVVNSETLTPRRQITSVVFSLQSQEAVHAMATDDAATLAGQPASAYDQSAHLLDNTNPHGVTAAQVGADPAGSAATAQGNLNIHTANSSAHHVKTTSFTELTDTVADAQIPVTIARSTAVTWGNLTGIPAGFADGTDNDSGGDITGVTAGTGLGGGGLGGDVTLGIQLPLNLTAADSGPLVRAENTGGGWAFYGITNSSSWPAVYGYNNTNGYMGSLGNINAGVQGNASGAGYGVKGTTSGYSSGVYGSNNNGNHGYLGGSVYGAYGHSKSTSGKGVFGSASHTDGTGVYGLATAATGNAYGIYGKTLSSSGYGIYGLANALSGTTYGVYGRSDSDNGHGLYGFAGSPTGSTYGVYGASASSSGKGVFGTASSTTGTTYGVFGWDFSDQGTGVFGKAESSTGQTKGVYGISAGDGGTGVYGLATSGSGNTYGVYGQSDSNSGFALYGNATNPTGSTYGVYGVSQSSSGKGVFGTASATTGTTYGVYGWNFSDQGTGVFGKSESATGQTKGVFGISASNSGTGVYGLATTGTGVYGESSGDLVSIGVKGHHSGSGRGVVGDSVGGIGVYGRSDGDIGVYGLTSSPTGYGVYSFGDIGARYDLAFLGTLDHSITVSNSTKSLFIGNGATPPWALWHEAKSYIAFKTNGTEKMRVTSSGNVGIGTINPAGTLDVNGKIYQRGGVLHADYVFEPDYELESIEEHKTFMWKNKHLKAIPKARTDEQGREIVEMGAQRKGIVEELEKAHIYIAQLHREIETLKSIVCINHPEAEACRGE